jgi:hypothetical protein
MFVRGIELLSHTNELCYTSDPSHSAVDICAPARKQQLTAAVSGEMCLVHGIRRMLRLQSRLSTYHSPLIPANQPINTHTRITLAAPGGHWCVHLAAQSGQRTRKSDRLAQCTSRVACTQDALLPRYSR